MSSRQCAAASQATLIIYKVKKLKSRKQDKIKLSHKGKRVEINVTDSSDIRAAIEELKSIQEAYEKQLAKQD